MIAIDWQGTFTKQGCPLKRVEKTFKAKSWPEAVQKITDFVSKEIADGWYCQCGYYTKISN